MTILGWLLFVVCVFVLCAREGSRRRYPLDRDEDRAKAVPPVIPVSSYAVIAQDPRSSPVRLRTRTAGAIGRIRGRRALATTGARRDPKGAETDHAASVSVNLTAGRAHHRRG
jgi:hypothetical protein